MLEQGTRWLMRMARLRNASAGAAESFEDAMTGSGFAFEPSRISRWEYGRSKGTGPLLRAYEAGCHLPDFELSAVNDRRTRAALGTFASRPTVDSPELHDRVTAHASLDRILAGEPITGSQWYQVACFATAGKGLYLTKPNALRLMRALLEQLPRSVGPGHVLRYEALHLLMSLPRFASAGVTALTALIEVGPPAPPVGAVSVLLRMAKPAQRTLLHRVKTIGTAATRQSVVRLNSLNRARRPYSAAAFDGRSVAVMAGAVHAGLPAWSNTRFDSDVTGTLLDTVLGDGHHGSRHEALILLMLAGFGPRFMDHVLELLDDETNPLMRSRLAGLIEYHIPATSPDRVVELALAERDPQVRRSLWAVRGHITVPIKFGAAVAEAVRDPDTRVDVTTALGLSGSIDSLQPYPPELDAPIRRDLEWWQRHGPVLFV